MKKFGKLLIGILTGCLLAATMSSCSQTYDYFFGDGEDTFTNDMQRIWGEMTESSEEISYQAPPKIEVSNYYTKPYDSPIERSFSESEIELYNLICYYIENYELTFYFENADEEEVIRVYKSVVADHPEYFWVNGGYRYTKTMFNNHTEIEFIPISYGDENSITAKDTKFQIKVQSIVEEARQYDTLYEQVLYVHDYLVDNTTYDHEAAAYKKKTANTDSTDNRYFDSSTAYGCLMNGRAVCSGYAAAFQCIMQELEIPCGRISGASRENGELHEWNYLTLGDYNYQIDVTWDDSSMTDGDGERTERKLYDYFLVTTEEMEITHIISDDQDIPECTGLECNYYIYNGLYLESYEFEYAAYVIRENADNGGVSLKFATEEEREKACTDLIDNDRIFEISGVGSHISYIKGNNGLTLTLTFSN